MPDSTPKAARAACTASGTNAIPAALPTPNHAVFTPEEARQLLSLNTIATKLGVSYWTVIREVNRKKLRAIKIGGIYRVRPSDFEAYLQAGETA